MMTRQRKGADQALVNLFVVGAFLLALFLFGGASRADTIAQIWVRLAAVGLLVFAAIRMRGEHWRRARAGVAFLLAGATLMLIQLIPLPPELWASLPGRALFGQLLAQGGISPVWRPLSVTPDLTMNSLFAILPALAAVTGLAMLDPPQRHFLVPALLVAIAVTSVIGMVQIATGSFYFFDVTNHGSAVGVFANRNHQAFLLAFALPLLGYWGSQPHPDPGYRQVRGWLALCFGAAIFPLLLMTGSRGGLVMGVLSLGATLVLLLRERRFRAGRGNTVAAVLKLLPLVVGAAAAGAMVLWSRGEAFDRLMASGEQETRLGYVPTLIQIARDYFPFGAGFGSFDPVFRSYEPYAFLKPTFLNHAHNDLLEITIEGGAAALLLLLVFIGWTLRATWLVWRDTVRAPANALARTGSIIVLLLLLAGLFDYALRTPLMAGVMAIAVAWLAGGERASRAQEPTGAPPPA